MALELPGWLIQAVQSLGIAGGPVMFFFWFLEYRQRREWQKDLIARNERWINTGNETANAIKEVTASVAGAQDTLKDQTTLLHEMTATMRSLVRRRSE